MTTVTSYGDSSLLGNTSYGYRVRATRRGWKSKQLFKYFLHNDAQGADTTPPSTPASLVATAASGTQIGLTWTASTDNVGVTDIRFSL